MFLEEEETENALGLLTKTKENPFGTPRFAVAAAMSVWADRAGAQGKNAAAKDLWKHGMRALCPPIRPRPLKNTCYASRTAIRTKSCC